MFIRQDDIVYSSGQGGSTTWQSYLINGGHIHRTKVGVDLLPFCTFSVLVFPVSFSSTFSDNFSKFSASFSTFPVSCSTFPVTFSKLVNFELFLVLFLFILLR